MIRALWRALLFGLIFTSVSAEAANTTAATFALDIPAGPVGESLNALARHSRLQIAIDPRDGKGIVTRRLVGTYTAEAALTELLRGTGLSFRYLNERTVAVRATPGASRSLVRRASLAQTESVPEPAQPPPEPALEEIIVTGSHIRGGATASPVIVYDRVEIEKSGAPTAQQFLATVPQNFGGGHSDRSQNEQLQADWSFGTSVNLRGLGSGTTLVLVNGRRSALGGTAQFVDVSMIPLSAVQRVDVLTDGASALYGSDALGGVVNFIMRERYEGAESLLRGGATTHGDGAEYLASQSYGHNWAGGSALLNYEYSKREAVRSERRSFSANTGLPTDLVPDQERHSVYAVANHDVSQALSLSIDGLYSERSSAFTTWNTLSETNIFSSADTKQYGTSLGGTFRLSDSWQAELSGGLNRNDVRSVSIEDSVPFVYRSQYDLNYAQALATGKVLTLPTGDVRLAAGLSHRSESYDSRSDFENVSGTYKARAVFGELQVPLLGGTDATPRTARLVLSLAGRYEDYTTFGKTFDPKFGLRWSPTPDVRLRATYGTSFRAPSAYQLDEFNATNALRNLADPATGGMTRTVIRLGNNPELHEETARTWTAGIDYTPRTLPGFTTNLTWFRINYAGRIQTPDLHFLQGFADPLYAGLITRRGDIPDADFNALVAQLLSGRVNISRCPTPLDPVTRACAESPSNFNAIYDSRMVNLAGLRTSGLDLLVQQHLDTHAGSFDAELNVSYVFDYEEQVTSIAPYLEYVDTGLNPLALRGRATLDWTRGRFGLTSSLNYADRYTNITTTPQTPVASWTTFDFNLRYELAGALERTSVGLFIANAFDRDPPAFRHEGLIARPIGYDPANADPLGRTVSLFVRRKW